MKTQDSVEKIRRAYNKAFNNLNEDVTGEALSQVKLKADGTIDLEAGGLYELKTFYKIEGLFHKEGGFTIEDVPVFANLLKESLKGVKWSKETENAFEHLAVLYGEDVPFPDHYSYKQRLETSKAIIKALDNASPIVKESFLSGFLWSASRSLIEAERKEFKGFDFDYERADEYSKKDLDEIERTFKRRNELPKDSLYRKEFVITYLDNQVYIRFFKDPDIKYTPEAGKEWDRHFNDLCEQYGEEHYKRSYSDEDYNSIKNELLCQYPILNIHDRKDRKKETAKLLGLPL